jgi:predicted NodU family carbamoyl transferase
LNILGIHAFTGPAAACLVRDGRIVAAAREELFTRRAWDASFPKNAIAYCLRAAKLGPSGLQAVAWCGRPEMALAQAIARALPFAKGYPIFRRTLTDWPDEFFDAEALVARELAQGIPVRFMEETLSHAAAAFFSSPYSNAAVLAIGSGFEEPHIVLAAGSGAALEILDEPAVRAPASIPAVRNPAPSFEEMAALARRAIERSQSNALVLAGPLDWKELAPRLGRAAKVEELWAHPAANGGASAAGAALLLSIREGEAPSRTLESADRLEAAWSYGPGYNSHQIRTFLRSRDVHTDELESEDLHARVATLLSEKKRVGWFQGRLDLGGSPVTSRSVLTMECEGEDPFVEAGGRRGFDELARLLEERVGRRALYASPLAKPGEPLACTPSDAYDCFAPLSLDAIAMGPYLVTRDMARDHSGSPAAENARASSRRKPAEDLAGFFLWLRLLPTLFTSAANTRDASAARTAKAWLAARRFLHGTHAPGS